MIKFAVAFAFALTTVLVPSAVVRVLAGSSIDVVDEAVAATPTLIDVPPPADEVVLPVIEPRPVSVSLTPDVTVIGASAEQQIAVDDAIARFRSAGLELPDVEVHFFDDEAGCHGHLGGFQRGFTPWRVLVCSDLAFVPTHELAHAWEAANLDDHERARYVEVRGMPTWNDHGADWNERGIEDAAFIIQQNLMAKHPNLDSPAWMERTAAYEFLTGSPSPLVRASGSDERGRTERELVDWAVGRFEAAGLELAPDLIVEFHRSTAPCGGSWGRYLDRDRLVMICTTSDDAETEDRRRRHVLLHELAHSWLSDELSDRHRAAFMRDRAAAAWNDSAHPWHERAYEQAAEILAWGLTDRPVGFLNIHDAGCERLREGYRLLTQAEAINPTIECA